MNKIDKDELYGHVREFLKTKGVELQEGPYTRRIQQGCHLLVKSINASQRALKQARSEVSRRLDRVRQAIHEKTAPKPPATAPPPAPEPAPSSSAAPPAKAAASGAQARRRRQPKRRGARTSR